MPTRSCIHYRTKPTSPTVAELTLTDLLASRPTRGYCSHKHAATRTNTRCRHSPCRHQDCGGCFARCTIPPAKLGDFS